MHTAFPAPSFVAAAFTDLNPSASSDPPVIVNVPVSTRTSFVHVPNSSRFRAVTVPPAMASPPVAQ
jgi:hypothetical protein